jgi:hypothetical protein
VDLEQVGVSEEGALAQDNYLPFSVVLKSNLMIGNSF